MSDQGFREIQLTGKQLVFLFMASVVVAVAIFLLGVSVGRGVRGTTATLAEAAPDTATADVPATMPPETVLTPADRSYHDRLQGQSTPPAQTPPPAPTAQPATPTVPPTQRPAPTPESAGARQAAAPARSAPAPAASTATAPEATGWFVQAGAFGTRTNAQRRVAELKSKGHAATIITASTAPAFRVRLGPFAERAEADRLAARVKAEGFDSSVTR